MSQLTMLKCKLHRATVTEADVDYEGSISIDEELIEAAGLLVHEQVDVLNISNGERLTTYVIVAPRGSKAICINGAAAHKMNVGDKVIICAYTHMDKEKAKTYTPTVILLGDENNIKRRGLEEYAVKVA